MGCADVCLSMDYDGSNAFFSEKPRRARKEHKCCECGEVIAVGATYYYASGKSDGDIFTERTCAVCREIRDAFSCGSYTFEMLWELMREEMFPLWRSRGPWDCLAKLTTPEAVAMCNSEFAEWLHDNEYDEVPTDRARGAAS